MRTLATLLIKALRLKKRQDRHLTLTHCFITQHFVQKNSEQLKIIKRGLTQERKPLKCATSEREMFTLTFW